MPKNSIYNFLKLGTDGPICSENIVFLLGAGASRDAGIPTLAEMSNSFEMKMQALEPDHIQRRLYNYFKEKSKSDKYSLGSSANVEDMLAIMEDLLHMHQERSVMYDLVSGWDKELMEIFQFDFGKIRELKNQLKDHVTEELCGKKGGSTLELDYFHFLFYLQKQLGGTLKIFTLNHDCCIEEAYRQYYSKQCEKSADGERKPALIETGFNDKILADGNYDRKESFVVDNFDRNEKCIKLYKLHGSIDWKKVEGGIEHTTNPQGSEIIFGISQKYKSEEPYSLLYPEFKKALSGKHEGENSDLNNSQQKRSSAKMLVVVGYSFNDQHINDAIMAAMRKNKELKILICDPGMIETYYFLLPQIPTKRGLQDQDFIKKIVSSEDYELYINMSVILHSVYYSRNFDEDALFLSACLDDATKDLHLLQKTNAARSAKEEQDAIMILENIFRLGKTEIKKVKSYFKNPRTEKSKEELNATIYDDILGVEVKYREIADCIDTLKIETYRIQKEVDIEKRKAGQDNRSLLDKTQAALELIDDLRMIEKFIKDFIPVHLSLMFGLIEQYQGMAGGNEKVNLRMHIFEMYLKYNYLIDAIEIKLIRTAGKTTFSETKKAIREILGEDYCKAFLLMAGEEKHDGMFTALEVVNAFLKNIKNRFLLNDLSPSLRNHEIVNKINGATGEVEFQDIFLSWRADLLEAGIPADEEHQNLDRILYDPKSIERLIQLKIMLYSKGLAKSMVDRFSHAQRLLHDLESMISIVLNEGDEKKTQQRIDEFFSALKKDIHASPDADEKQGKSYNKLLLLLHGDFWASAEGGSDLKTEVNNKVPANLNWYVTRFFNLQKELTDALFTVRFSLPGKGIDYRKNMKIYASIFNKLKDERWVNLENEMKRYGGDVFYKAKTWDEIDKLFGQPDGSSCLDRISVCHFPAKIFFTKTLRAYTLFRTYYSAFYAQEHLRYFCDINRMILSRRPAR